MSGVSVPVGVRTRVHRANTPGPLALLAAEGRKIRRTWILPLTLLGPVGVTLMGVIYWLLQEERVAEALASGTPPFAVLMNALALVQVFSLMLGTTLLASMLADVDHRSDTWKQLFAMPVSRAGTFASKFAWLAVLLAVSSALLCLGYAALWVWQGYGAIPWMKLARACALPFLAVLPFAGLQLVASTAIRNQAAPLTLGILAPMFVVGGAPVPGWFPWAMPHASMFEVFGKELEYAGLWPAVGLEVVLFVAIGAVMLARREIR